MPKEPTIGMLVAGGQYRVSTERPNAQHAIYAAMLASAPPAPQDKHCPLCKYQHGHQIGCENNPVDIALKAQAAHKIGEKK